MQDIDSFQLELGQTSEIGLALTLALMMFSVALGLKTEHFRFFKTEPRIYFGGVIGQLLLLPALTLGLCYALDPAPSIALGMILVACCPGGNVSNMLVLLARGNTALSVSLTATSSIAAAFITPVSIVFWCSLYPPTSQLLTKVDFDTFSFLIQTTVILALPLILGMSMARYLPRLSQSIRSPLVLLSSLGLLVIIVSSSYTYLDQFLSIGIGLVGIVAVHNLAAFLLGLLCAKASRADERSMRAITFEVGIQNSGLAIVILLTQLGGLGGAAAVAGLWGTWHILAGLVLVAIFRSRG